MFRRWLCPRLVVIAAVLTLQSIASAGLEILAHSARIDEANQRVLFSIKFNRAPDFNALDSDDQPRDSFQYWYDCNPGGDEFTAADVVVIRGAEIHRAHEIPLRDSLNPTGKDFPGAEGWGAERAAVPFTLNGATLTFAAGFNQLGECDDRFSYRLMSFESGEVISDVSSAIVVPLPLAGLAGSVGLLLTYSRIRKSRSIGV